jgi:hypothetical protein
MTHSVHIFSDVNRIASYEQDIFNICLYLVCFKKFACLYSRVGAAAAGATSKFYPELEPQKNDAAPQHCL